MNGQRTMKLLIVDDEEINIKLLASILEDKKITPLFATNGSDALAMARKELPDLILLDVIMPDIDGYEVCKRLQADPATKDIPIIFLTGQRSAVDEAKGLDMGAVDYIFKPYDPHIVRSKIQNQLALRGGGSGKNSAGGGGGCDCGGRRGYFLWQRFGIFPGVVRRRRARGHRSPTKIGGQCRSTVGGWVGGSDAVRGNSSGRMVGL